MATPYSIIPIIICVIVALFVVSFISAQCSKPKGQRNNVHYYVTKDWSHIDLGDFIDMENGEIREVFINMED